MFTQKKKKERKKERKKKELKMQAVSNVLI